MKRLMCIGLVLLAASCKRTFEAPVPATPWELFQSADARPLTAGQQRNLEGIYNLAEGSELFGNAAALKWSYTVSGADTVYHASIFCAKDVLFMVLEGRRLNGDVLLNGYWRRKINTETGRVRLTLRAADGATDVLNGIRPGNLVWTGQYGLGESEPATPLRLQLARDLRSNDGFEILAHRGGGRNDDLLPASENSLEMLRLAARLGATGVEIDVQRTSDEELILYHDATLNERLIKKNGLVGPIENYSWAQLNALVELKRGGKIPTLRQALTTILEETPLRFVWIDTKVKGPLQKLRQIQQEFLEKAAVRGRQLQIVIGIPDEEVAANFKALPGYATIPSLSELDIPQTRSLDANVWAPTWTLGLQTAEVASMQAEGRKAFVWTLDSPDRIQQYINEGQFNGILSNQASAVAFYFYAKQ